VNLLPARTASDLFNAVHFLDLFSLCDWIYEAGVVVDFIFADLPYAVTQNSWDTLIPLEPMWRRFRRIIKSDGVIALTGSQPFTSMLVMSALDLFRYEMIWEKPRGSGFLDANRRPLRSHENILIFSRKEPVYFPQMEAGTPYKAKTKGKTTNYGKFDLLGTVNEGWRYPKTVHQFANETGLHPTQKPVSLIEYLIRTYTLSGDVVLDPTCGSGTTGVAARNTGRRYILGDNSPVHSVTARKRLSVAYTLPMFADNFA